MGYLTLVETKLWDNPQARREVVGQIVEYAKDFSHWTFEELDDAVQRAGGGEARGILDIVRRYEPDLGEAAFIDTVTRTLRRGAFLLLVVGDGIREGVETLTAFLQRTPSLHFSLALVELALYRPNDDEDWPLLIQPRTVARTAEVVRAVIEVRGPSDLQVDVTLPSDDNAHQVKSRTSLTEEAFFEQLGANTSSEVAAAVGSLVADLHDEGVVPQWRATGVSMRLPDPHGLAREWTVLFLGTSGVFWLGYLSHISQYGGYDERIWRRYLEGAKKLTGVEAPPKTTDGTRSGAIRKLLHHRVEFMALVQQFIDDLRGAARSPEG